ncbi:hypothetical protein EGT49_07845 [Companilactobacillus suantsaicola]|uniref:Uncharacterized protein n=1 Tax=Companilactobacillus suantsaicola TaxID=2487723 RepID=A0A4Z0JIZ9_9LACO|nr:hypothetical protein [Companilactobacillus suantsaicola]TGD22826.1 hypothetical protein EGT49_07845 [Companilactobacillus suantsaicola]
MDTLKLTDEEAQKLIDLLKLTLTKQKFILNEGLKGKIKIVGKLNGNDHYFFLSFMYAIDNIHLNFYDAVTNHTLVRINLDSKFHKNSDGVIRGNRVEIFSKDEFIAKNDGVTQIKAYSLPYKNFRNSNDFFDALEDIFNYTNVKDHRSITFEKNNILNTEL